MKILVGAAKGEWKTLSLLADFAGARMSDCCRMAWADVDLGEATLTYTQSKTGEKVTMPIHTDLLAHVNTLAGTDKTGSVPHAPHGQPQIRRAEGAFRNL